jgi:hypothetical protein
MGVGVSSQKSGVWIPPYKIDVNLWLYYINGTILLGKIIFKRKRGECMAHSPLQGTAVKQGVI